MSLEEMAEQYSKKWNVPVKEAAEIIQKRLDKKPEKEIDRTKSTPTKDLVFPDPLSEVSKKIMGLNQAALSTALTHKSLREMNQPPKEMQSLREKIESVEGHVDQVVGLVEGTMKEWHDELDTRKAAEERANLVNEFKEIIAPLKKQVEELEKVKEGTGGDSDQLTPENLVKTSHAVNDRAIKFLKDQGFDVKMPEALSVAQVEAKIQTALETKKKDWEAKAGAEVEIEKERIRATEEILTSVVDRVFNIFLEPIKDKIHEAIEQGAFSRGPK